MTDEDFALVGASVVTTTGDLPYVLSMHDEDTGQMRICSNLTVESMIKMLTVALDHASSDDFERTSVSAITKQ